MMKCARRPASQRVIDKPGDRCAIARAGKAMRQTPGLESVGGWTALALNRSKDLDGCGKPRCRCHGRAEENAHDIDQPHDDQDERAYAVESTPDAHIVVGHVHQRLHPAA